MYKLYIYQAVIYTNIAIYKHINLLLTYLQNQKIKKTCFILANMQLALIYLYMSYDNGI